MHVGFHGIFYVDIRKKADYLTELHILAGSFSQNENNS